MSIQPSCLKLQHPDFVGGTVGNSIQLL